MDDKLEDLIMTLSRAQEAQTLLDRLCAELSIRPYDHRLSRDTQRRLQDYWDYDDSE